MNNLTSDAELQIKKVLESIDGIQTERFISNGILILCKIRISWRKKPQIHICHCLQCSVQNSFSSLLVPPYFQRTRKNRDNLEWQDVSEVWEQGHNYVTLSGSFQGRVNESFAPKIYLKINPQVNWDFAITTCKVSQIQITIASFNVAEHVQLAWMQATANRHSLVQTFLTGRS